MVAIVDVDPSNLEPAIRYIGENPSDINLDLMVAWVQGYLFRGPPSMMRIMDQRYLYRRTDWTTDHLPPLAQQGGSSEDPVRLSQQALLGIGQWMFSRFSFGCDA